jgi:hypothetical protein
MNMKITLLALPAKCVGFGASGLIRAVAAAASRASIH